MVYEKTKHISPDRFASYLKQMSVAMFACVLNAATFIQESCLLKDKIYQIKMWFHQFMDGCVTSQKFYSMGMFDNIV